MYIRNVEERKGQRDREEKLWENAQSMVGSSEQLSVLLVAFFSS